MLMMVMIIHDPTISDYLSIRTAHVYLPIATIQRAIEDLIDGHNLYTYHI